MEFRRNIMLSVVIHAALITVAAGFVAGRDAGFRVPEKFITVALLESLIKGDPSPTPDSKNITTADTRPAITRKKDKGPKQPSHEEIPQQEGFFPPQAGEKETQPDSGGQNGAGFDSSGVALQSRRTGKGNSSPGNPWGSSSGGPPAREGDFQETSGNAARNPDVIGAVRAAIEKAKSYPPLARKWGIEGTVTAEFTISATGYPENIRIVKSSGYEILDTAARKTLLRASPLPVIKGNLTVPITFKIDR